MGNVAWDRFRKHWRVGILVLAPALLSLLPILSGNTEQSRCGFLLLLMAIYWLFEALPLSYTAMLPFFLGPLLCIGSTATLSRLYFSEFHFLVIGGTILSVAMDSTKLNRRLALKVVLAVGTKPRWLLLGFMLPSWLLSMWMCNTATTILMFPFVNAAIDELEKAADVEADDKEAEAPSKSKSALSRSLSICYCLSVPYAANVGGVATMIGSAANLVFTAQLTQLYGSSTIVTFANWLYFSLPLSAICLILVWLLLQLVFLCRRSHRTGCCSDASEEMQQRQERIRDFFKRQLQQLGPMRFSQWATLLAFPLTLLLLLLGSLTSDFGWHKLFPTGTVADATGMLIGTLPLLLLPMGASEDPSDSLGYRPIARWRDVTRRVPLDVLLLIGGGMALAQVSKDSKLSASIGAALLPVFKALPFELTVFLVCFFVAWLTEVMSNTAVASVLLPVAAQVSACIGTHPLALMMPLTLVCSFAFCLPSGAPPNAVAFATGRVSIPQMARAGAAINVVLSIVTAAYSLGMGRLVFNTGVVPDWASGVQCGNATAG